VVRTLDEIAKAVCEFIVRPEPEGFEPLAFDVFAFQFHRNLSYRNYCLYKGMTPDTVSRWNEIPAVPTGAFKEMELTCLSPTEKPEAVFLTSGTTRGLSKPGRHCIPRRSVYETAARTNFETCLLPDRARLRMMILTASPSKWPRSSLVHMMEVVRTAYGAPGATYYIKDEGLDLDVLIKDLKDAEDENEPVFLLGITLAFYQLMKRLRELGIRFHLAHGSRLMDTGGFKGRNTDIEKEELYSVYQKALGIPFHFIVNEYGMTEMGSQFYDNVLVNSLSRRNQPRFKIIPPWVRTKVVDPDTLEEVPRGSAGLLHHLDLANCGTVMALLTEDLGYTVDDGFELAGRIEGAEPRGCALLMEEIKRPS
jgi:hypothetical protein